jgi:hypothetical protein
METPEGYADRVAFGSDALGVKLGHRRVGLPLRCAMRCQMLSSSGRP